jgi:DNA invertase Pin-like site-specific DNA recombinase
MRIGYARVSTQDQNLDLQKDALKKAGCEKFVVEIASGKNEARAGLEKLHEVMRKGDVIVVWRLDRVGRLLSYLIEVIKELNRTTRDSYTSSLAVDSVALGLNISEQNRRPPDLRLACSSSSPLARLRSE